MLLGGVSSSHHPCGDTYKPLHHTWHPNISVLEHYTWRGWVLVLIGKHGAGFCLIRASLFGMCLMKRGQPGRRNQTCVLMGDLAGPVAPAAFRGQPVDDVILVKSIFHPGKEQIAQVLNGLDVGLGVPEGRGCRRPEWMEARDWREEKGCAGGVPIHWRQAALWHSSVVPDPESSTRGMGSQALPVPGVRALWLNGGLVWARYECAEGSGKNVAFMMFNIQAAQAACQASAQRRQEQGPCKGRVISDLSVWRLPWWLKAHFMMVSRVIKEMGLQISRCGFRLMRSSHLSCGGSGGHRSYSTPSEGLC